MLRPAGSKLKRYISDYTPVTPPALTAVGGESFTADVNKSLALTWLDRNGIAAVSRATPEQPVRVATIKFQWILGARDTSHIGITHSEFGVARIRGASIKVQGPAVDPSISTQTENINVNADASPISVKCSLSRPFAGKTTCILGIKSDSGVDLASAFVPKIKGAEIPIPKGKMSASKKFKIRPNAADSGRIFRITLDSVRFGNETLTFDGPSPKISLESPAVVVSKPGTDPKEIVEEITVEEGETEELGVSLAARPNGKVIVRARTDFHTTVKKVTITPASLTFTAKNWNQRQPVSVSSADDKIADGNRFVTVGFGVDYGKSGATNYNNADTPRERIKITENDMASLAIAVKPKNIITAGAHPIAITATLKGGGVFRTAKYVELSVNTNGSADENAYYVPPTLPTEIIIPE
ncbi:MAG: hypothetical protein MPJ22_11360, partial [Pirellulales bacterium]|nr:hypothetical protein [Pirellulales bacterium]